MPVIHFYGPELPKEKKEEMVRGFSEAASRATGIPVQSMVVCVHEMNREDVGVGGDLLANLK